MNDQSALIDALKKDGAIVDSSAYTIELDNGMLTVNGQQVDAAKYKDLLKGDKIKIKVQQN
jgi:hypothetical protein